MVDGHHLKIVKSHLSNGLTDRREVWHDDDIGPMNFTLPPIYYAYYFLIITTKHIQTKNGFSVSAL